MGEHAALAPVNNDVQAKQIPNAYLDDDEDVAAAKASFQAAFDEVAARQAPVHHIPEATTPLPYPYPVFPYHISYPYHLPHSLLYNHLPYLF